MQAEIVVSLLILVCPDLAAEGALGQCFVYSVNYRSGPSVAAAMRFLSSNYVQINTFLAPSDTKMVRAVTM